MSTPAAAVLNQTSAFISHVASQVSSSVVHLLSLFEKSFLTRFRRASNGEVIHGLKRGFSLVACHCGYFFSWSEIFSYPFIKRAFSYNTVFISFFEEKSNIFMLRYRLAEKNWIGSTVKERRELPGKSHIHYLCSRRAWKTGGAGGWCRGWGGGGSSIIKARNPFFWSKAKWSWIFKNLLCLSL